MKIKKSPSWNMTGSSEPWIKEKSVLVRNALKLLEVSDEWELSEVSKSDSDLDCLVSILEEAGAIPPTNAAFFGNLNLSGKILPIRNMVNTMLAYQETALNSGITKIVVSEYNANEAAEVGTNIEVLAVQNVHELVAFLRGETNLVRCISDWSPGKYNFSMKEVHLDGIEEVIKAALGWKKIFLIGNPGTGKTMIARRLVSMIARRLVSELPQLTHAQAVELSRVHSKVGLLQDGILNTRPFRAPHFTVSEKGLEQEVELSKGGVLLLDELNEFRASSIELVLNKLKEETVLVGSMNSCACGSIRCSCSDERKLSYSHLLNSIKKKFDVCFRLNAGSCSPEI